MDLDEIKEDISQRWTCDSLLLRSLRFGVMLKRAAVTFCDVNGGTACPGVDQQSALQYPTMSSRCACIASLRK